MVSLALIKTRFAAFHVQDLRQYSFSTGLRKFRFAAEARLSMKDLYERVKQIYICKAGRAGGID